MTSTPEYDAIRMALISCRERFRSMIDEARMYNAREPVGWTYALEQAESGFKEVDAILSNPDNQEK